MEAPRDRRCVERVVEVRVPDEHAGDLAAVGADVAVEHRRVRHRPLAQQQAAQRHARDVRIDEQRHALIGDAVAADAEPRQLETCGQRERNGLEPVQCVRVCVRG